MSDLRDSINIISRQIAAINEELVNQGIEPDKHSEIVLEAARKYANALPMHAESGRVTWNVSVEGDPVEGWLITEDADG